MFVTYKEYIQYPVESTFNIPTNGRIINFCTQLTIQKLTPGDNNFQKKKIYFSFSAKNKK